MQSELDCIPVSSLHRCVNCDKPYSVDGLSPQSVTSLSGGICFSCGRPALSDLVQDSLDDQRPSNEIAAANTNLEDLLHRLREAFKASEELLLDIRKARFRSSEAARTKTGSESSLLKLFGQMRTPLVHQLELARSELVDLETFMSSMNDAGVVISLQESSNSLDDDLIKATKHLRQLQSDNTRRDIELNRKISKPSSLLSEDQIRKDLFAIRSRNTELTQKNATYQKQSEAHKSLIEAVAERDALRLKLADIKAKNNFRMALVRSSLDRLPTLPVTSTSSTLPIATLESIPYASSSRTIDEDAQEACSHCSQTAIRKTITGDNVGDFHIDAPLNAANLVDITDSDSHIAQVSKDRINEEESELSFVVPEILEFPVESGVDEPVHAVAPRCLFQAESVKNQVEDLGEALDTVQQYIDQSGLMNESFLPPIHIPSLFDISSRTASNIENN